MAMEQTAPDEGSSRRGQPLRYVSYWAQQRRTQRKQVFALREQGYAVAAIADELGMAVSEVEATLLSDRRSKPRVRRPSAS
jgi:hypothetical protein